LLGLAVAAATWVLLDWIIPAVPISRVPVVIAPGLWWRLVAIVVIAGVGTVLLSYSRSASLTGFLSLAAAITLRLISERALQKSTGPQALRTLLEIILPFGDATFKQLPILLGLAGAWLALALRAKRLQASGWIR
jgi:hypothetical protein